MTILSDLRDTMDYAAAANKIPERLHVPSSENYLRRALGIKKPEPLTYRGVPIVLVPSARARKRHEDQQESAFKAAQLDFVAEGHR